MGSPANLVYRTKLAELNARRNCKFFLFGESGGEASIVFSAPPKVKDQAESKLGELVVEKRERDPRENEERAARRAKGQCRRFAKHNALRVMVTLTFPGTGVHDYDVAYKLLRGWMKRVGSTLLGIWLAVPERHPGGHGIHWHLLIPARLSPEGLALLRESWTAHLVTNGHAPTGGAKWVRVHVRDMKGFRDKSAVAASALYASKYVTKSFSDGGAVPPGRQRYLVSEDGQPVPLTGYLNNDQEFWKVVEDLSPGVLDGFCFDSADDPEWDKPFRIIITIWD